MKELLTSRRFWVALLALVALVASVYVPDFSLDPEAAASLSVIVVSYLVGVSVDPGPGGWRGVVKSRKFWAAAIGLVMVFLDAFHVILPVQIPADVLVTMAVVIGGYIASVAFELPKLAYPSDMFPDDEDEDDEAE